MSKRKSLSSKKDLNGGSKRRGYPQEKEDGIKNGKMSIFGLFIISCLVGVYHEVAFKYPLKHKKLLL